MHTTEKDEFIEILKDANKKLAAHAREKSDEAELLREALITLVSVARRYLPDYDEHPDIQKADAALAWHWGNEA